MGKLRARIIQNPIPLIRHPMGKGLNQVDSCLFTFYLIPSGALMVHIPGNLMSQIPLREWGLPTGVYEGKFWQNKKYLTWFDISDKDPSMCMTVSAGIAITSTNKH